MFSPTARAGMTCRGYDNATVSVRFPDGAGFDLCFAHVASSIIAVFGENRAWLEVCCGTTIRLRLMSAIQGGALGGMLFRSLLQEPSLSRYVPNSTTWSFITRVRNEEGEKIVDANRDPHHSRAPYKAACNHERGCAIHMTELCVVH